LAQHNHGIVVLGQVNDLTGAAWHNITNIDIADIPQIKKDTPLEIKLCIGLANKFTLKQWSKNPEREFEIKGDEGEYIKYCVYLMPGWRPNGESTVSSARCVKPMIEGDFDGTVEVEVLHVSTRNPNVTCAND